MFASEKVMLEYLGQLLNEDENMLPVAKDVKVAPSIIRQPRTARVSEASVKPLLRPISSAMNKLQEYQEAPSPSLPEPNSIEKLLQQVEIKQQVEKKIKEDEKSVDLVSTDTNIQPTVEVSPKEHSVQIKEDVFPDEAFQALFFEVAGLVLAVPLKELGGIHNLTDVNSLIGKPKWFKGVMLNREKKLNVVDSAMWVMPEKYNASMQDIVDYKYLITLGESDWGLTAEKLVETATIQPNEVKWRNGQGKRPWLLGTIKEKMCALLHVSDLIAMLEQGINARQE